MKKIIFSYLIACGMLSACSIDVEPTDRYADGLAWSEPKNLDIYVSGFYTALRDQADIYTNTMADGMSDMLKYSVNNLNGSTFQNKLLLTDNYISSNNGVLSEWGNYGRIKRYNEFLYQAEKNPGGLSEDFLKIKKAEVRFLRAYMYFLMARNHGGVILRLHNSGLAGGLDTDVDAAKPRATEAETWRFIIDELQEVAVALEGHQWAAEQYGRITRAAALGFLSRVALYAKDYDVVIAAVNQLEDLSPALEQDYSQVFTNARSAEILLPVLFDAPDYVHFFDRHFQPVGDVSNRGGWAGPTEELVVNYQIKTGDTYEDFNWNNPAHSRDPYSHREPRFYASILYHGASWKGRTLETLPGSKDAFSPYDINSNTPANVTGYYMRKFLSEGLSDVDLGGEKHWVFLRLGEVYLNVAEAYAHQQNWDKAYDYLNKIRRRAQVPTRATGNNLTLFIDLLAKERMVELAFEGHRYWDLRRWAMAETTIHGQRATGVRTSLSGGQLLFERVPVETTDRIFHERYYRIPIPQGEIVNNPLVEQNLGW